MADNNAIEGTLEVLGPVKWEYEFLAWTDDDLATGEAEDWMGALGAEGWELVSVLVIGPANNADYRGFFKRPLQAEQEGGQGL